MSLGNRIKELREKNGKTQLDVSKYLDVTYQTIYKYEKDIAVPPADAIIKLAEYFNVTTDYLLGRTDEPNDIIKDKNLHMAAYSDIDLAKLAQLEPKKKKAIVDNINNMIEMFYEEFGKKEE